MADTPSPPSPEILEKLRQLREELAQKAAQQAPKSADTLAWQQSNAFKRIYPRAKGGIVSQLRRNGKGVSSELEAMRRMSQGHRVFVTHEQDERPREITSVRELYAYTPDQMYTLAPEAKANGGVIDMDRMRLELMGKAKGGITYPMAPRGEWYGEGTYDKEGGVMKQVTPDDYLAKVRPLTLDDESRENIDLLKKHIQSGKTLDPLLIRASGKEDGRHRAHAAKELGIKKVPVIDYGKHFKAKGGITHAHHLDIEERPL